MTAGDVTFTHHARTDKGRSRPGNEDNYYDGTTVFAVADGMGGHAAGEVASFTALKPLEQVDGRTFASAEQADRALANAVRTANGDVIRQAEADPQYRGMGTTLTAVLVRQGRLHIAHVGDSRAYLFRPGTGIRQVTTDHTLVEQLVREGRLSREQVSTHPQRSVITRAIGVEASVDVDTLGPLELRAGDQVLLCSDGLSGPVEDDEIGRLLSETADGDAACTALIDAANRAGGPDNITAVLLRVVEGAETADDDATTALAPVEQAGTTAALDDDTAELRPLPKQGDIRRIRTREDGDGAGAFDASRFGHLGQTQGVEGRSQSDGAPPRSARRLLGALLGALVLLVIVGGGAWFLVARSYYVGVDDDGQVAIFTGLPSTFAGLRLSSVTEVSDLPAADLPPFRQDRLEAGIVQPSLEEARGLVADLEEQSQAEPTPTPSPTRASPTANSGDLAAACAAFDRALLESAVPRVLSDAETAELFENVAEREAAGTALEEPIFAVAAGYRRGDVDIPSDRIVNLCASAPVAAPPTTPPTVDVTPLAPQPTPSA